MMNAFATVTALLTMFLWLLAAGCTSEFATRTTVQEIDTQTTHDVEVKPPAPIPLSAKTVPPEEPPLALPLVPGG